ncbi:NAD(P)H-binding protein [Cohnella sp. GCM10012308]|uniref:NmrA family NAD(P)-binding protein n=1 Tax=Cohnella sp. GCM10012308 TaxID=3317329 RepID=UPI0036189F96
MKIVLTGATGHLGSLVLKELLRRVPAVNIAIVTRRPAEFQNDSGVEVRYGDYEDASSLPEAFRGADRLLFVSSPQRDEEARLRQHRTVVAAAKEAGTGRIVYTGIAYAEKGRLPLHRLHLDTERFIRESGLSYTILRNAFYMDLVEMLGWRTAVAGGVLLSPPGTWRFNTVAREDLAAAAAVVLAEDEHLDRVYELTASRSWDLKELARALSELSGRRIEHRTDPAMNGGAYAMLPFSDTASVSPDLEALIGARPLGVKEWLADRMP